MLANHRRQGRITAAPDTQLLLRERDLDAGLFERFGNRHPKLAGNAVPVAIVGDPADEPEVELAVTE